MTLEVTPRGKRGSKYPRAMVVLLGLMPTLYRVIGGLGMGSTLVLTTIGAKTGLRRDAHLNAFPEGFPEAMSWLVVASKGGDARHPAWFLNLAAHPNEVWVQVGMRQMQVRVEVLKGDERTANWHRIVGLASQYGDYAAKTDREIPIVRLSPVEMIKQVQVQPMLLGGA